jgi:hypothetical protein
MPYGTSAACNELLPTYLQIYSCCRCHIALGRTVPTAMLHGDRRSMGLQPQICLLHAATGTGSGGGVQVTMKLVFVSARPVLIVAKEMALLTTPTPSAS